MAYKFQLGAYTASGSLKQEGALECETSLTIGSAEMSEADLEKLDGITDGTAAANKAVVLDASKNIATIGTIGCGAITSTGNSTFGRVQIDSANDYIDVDTDLKLIAAADIVLDPAGSDVKVDGNVIPNSDDGGTLGSANNNWSDLFLADGAVVNFGDDQEITLTHTADTQLTFESAVDDFLIEVKGTHAGANGVGIVMHRSSSSPADNDVIGAVEFRGYDDGGNLHQYGNIKVSAVDVSAGAEQGKMELQVAEFDGTTTTGLALEGLASNGDITVDISTHDGAAGGLKLGGTLVTATATELNLLDGITRGSILVGGSGGSAELDAKTSGQILVGDGTDIASVAVSGDATLASNGALSLAAAQTNITSLLATDIKIGEDDQTKIDFEDVNKINFYANNAKELVLEENKLTPGTNDGTALGDSSLGFSDLYLADGGAIEFGNDQDSKLYWAAADSLRVESAQDDFVLELKNTNAGANGATFRIQASSSSPADDDKIGGVEFMGYDDGGGAHQFGVIEVTATDVSAGAEQGKMELKVAENDGTATAGITLEGQTSDGVVNVTIGAGAASTTTIAGNLTVNGTTTTVNSTTINITSSFTFEGPADAHETTFGIVDPTADATINLPAMSAGTYFVPVLAAVSTTAISSTPAELNLLDGSAKSTSSITLADADGFIVIDGNTTKQIPASDIKTYIGSSANLDVALKDDTETLATGVNYFADFGGAESVNLPASPTVGDSVYIKAPSNCNSTNTLTINRQGSHTIDGETSIVLESPHAAVMCVYVVANVWKVF